MLPGFNNDLDELVDHFASAGAAGNDGAGGGSADPSGGGGYDSGSDSVGDSVDAEAQLGKDTAGSTTTTAADPGTHSPGSGLVNGPGCQGRGVARHCG